MEEVSNIIKMTEEHNTRPYERRVTHVIKRDNKRAEFSLEKISARINKLCWNLDPDYIDPDSISNAVSKLMYEDIRTEEIDFLTADLCANKIYVHPDFNLLAGRICISNLHKTTDPNFGNVVTRLYQHGRHGTHNPLVSKELYDIVIEHKDKIQQQFRFEKDYNFNFFALKTLEKAYLTRIKGNKNKTISEQNENEHELRKRYGVIIERPQHMFMRVAIGIHGTDLERAFETYHAMADKLFIHATPTLYNAGTPIPQLSSCFLMSMQDSLHGMYNVTISDAAQISKRAGGIGISLSDIRANGSYIRGTNGVSDGIIPLCRVLNEVSVHVNQGGRRNGSIACFVKDTEVFTTNAGVKKIQDVQIGDMVVTHKNRVRSVIQTHKNPLGNRKIYKLEVQHNKTIYVTGNHKFWSFYTKKYKTDQLSLGWNSIEDLKRLIDDKETTRQACYISAPRGTNIVNDNNYKIDIADFKTQIESSGNKTLHELDNGMVFTKTRDDNGTIESHSKYINKVWDIDEDLANFFGIWLGDGHIKKDKTGGKIVGISIAMHSGNVELREYIYKVCEEKFGCDVRSYTPKERNTTHLTIYSSLIGIIFNELFGSYFDGKYLPNMVFSWPRNLIHSLLAGLITSDGHINKSAQHVSIGLSNERLVTQLYHLCRANGITVSFEGKGMTCDPYSISIPAIKNIIEKTHKLYDDDRVERCLDNLDESIHNSTDPFLKVLSISETDRNDKYVYTLGVAEDHSYTVEGLVAENCYLETWHADIWNFVELRLKSGDEKMRARKLFLALWVCDLFMERVWEDKMWSLMCPDECPGLTDVYGDEFNKLYTKYESEGRYKSQISAKKLWLHILEAQIETGMPYMAYKDHGNRKSNQKNLGTIKCSNLCCEIFEYTSATETAVCNLASLCLPTYVKIDDNGNKTFDFEGLSKSTQILTRNLNRIIDINFYPVEATKISNLKHRPIGIGVQGFADALYKMGYSFISDEAKVLNKKIFEAIYFGAVTESVKLAKEFGPYSSFEGSPASEGKLQFHLWDISTDDLLLGWDWNSLVDDVKKYGLYNSLLTAVMPTASTAHIMGNYECTEVPTTNMYVRNTQTGEYIVANEHLMRDLLKLGLWTKDIIDEIQYDGGSIQNIDKIPNNIKELYMTAYEVSKKVMIDLTADRGPFIDQSQSFNIFNDTTDFKVLTSIHFYGWKRGLKTGMYYHRGRPASDGIKFGIDSDIINSIKDKRSRKQDPRRTNEIEDNQSVKICRYMKPGDSYEACEMCSG